MYVLAQDTNFIVLNTDGTVAPVTTDPDAATAFSNIEDAADRIQAAAIAAGAPIRVTAVIPATVTRTLGTPIT